jgi:hypothetical protein
MNSRYGSGRPATGYEIDGRETMKVWRTIARVALCLTVIAVLLNAVVVCGCGDGTPKVSWNKPGSGDEVFGIARLKVSATSSENISQVKFYFDSVDSAHLIGTVSNPTDSLFTQVWYTTTVQNGEHTLYAVATDVKEKSAQASRTVTVSNVTRAMAIDDKVTWAKWTPQTDAHDPVLEASFSQYFYDPEPLGPPINTAGAEDSPFITPDGNNFYFMFTPDMNIPVNLQLLDRVTGIYWSQKAGGTWTEPQRVWLNDDLSMDGAETILGNTMWFASVRAGVKREIDLYSAELVNGVWTNWANLGEPLNVAYQVGELHLSADGNQVYFHSERAGGKGDMDIWVISKINGQWQTPVNVAAVNTADGEGWPYLSENGNELWFTRHTAANKIPMGIFRSVKVNGVWQTPERVLSSLAGEPTLDSQGNLYFVHHYYDDAAQKLWEADIYVCRRK